MLFYLYHIPSNSYMCCSTLPKNINDYKVITKEEYDAAIKELFKDKETNEDKVELTDSL